MAWSISLDLTSPLTSITAQQDLLSLVQRLSCEAQCCIRAINYSCLISLENHCIHSSSSCLEIRTCMHGSFICIRDMLPPEWHPTEPVSIQCVTTEPIFLAQLAMRRVCLSVLLFLISESRGSLSTRWLQNLYVAMAPSWHSLGGLEVFHCQRSNLLKWFACHVGDICLQWKDGNLWGWAMRRRRRKLQKCISSLFKYFGGVTIEYVFSNVSLTHISFRSWCRPKTELQLPCIGKNCDINMKKMHYK